MENMLSVPESCSFEPLSVQVLTPSKRETKQAGWVHLEKNWPPNGIFMIDYE